MDELIFQYHLQNTRSIELSKFTASLSSLDMMFKESTQIKDAKLYVHTVREGSIIVDLVQYVGVGMLNFPDVAPLFVSFAEALFLKIKEAIIGQSIKHWNAEELKAVSDILSPAAKGENKLGLSVINNNGVIYNNCTCSVEASQANSAISCIKAEEDRRRASILGEEVYEELLVVTQLRNESSEYGSLGVIDRFGNKPKRLLFATGAKEIISHQSDNPFKHMYFVRFSVKTANGQIQAYYISEVLESIPLEE